MNKIYFSTVKEIRGKYFVEYHPPAPDNSFAILSITFLVECSHKQIIKIMEQEARIWLTAYPIALMISSFNNEGDLIYLEEAKSSSHLICFFNKNKTKIEFHWKILKNDELPKDALNVNYLLQIYESFDRKTSTELELQASTRLKKIRLGNKIIIFWAVGLPALLLVVEFFIPQWLAFLVLIYGLYKAFVQWRKMTGKWVKSTAEIEKETEDLQMRHHHYHCKMNPDGFLRLKLENFSSESKAKIHEEAKAITHNQNLKNP